MNSLSNTAHRRTMTRRFTVFLTVTFTSTLTFAIAVSSFRSYLPCAQGALSAVTDGFG
nr:MAG TPA: hypothetical protein [Siphoviridae sp. cta6m1]